MSFSPVVSSWFSEASTFLHALRSVSLRRRFAAVSQGSPFCRVLLTVAGREFRRLTAPGCKDQCAESECEEMSRCPGSQSLTPGAQLLTPDSAGHDSSWHGVSARVK